ncbi:hypothetical protein ZIOFF_018515 [Zingiber officinale]|uniref:Uncharacterized protein n=1 Tax=Zingiber officinale TaxID=94328 RepID=A0A8J5LM05_ZINOF|nr:hypothetical protein ZIOFF_018515 [Zingiber officinale]
MLEQLQQSRKRKRRIDKGVDGNCSSLEREKDGPKEESTGEDEEEESAGEKEEEIGDLAKASLGVEAEIVVGWVEGMAPVFSRSAWQCLWHLIQGNPIVGVLIFLYSADVVGMYCPQGPGNVLRHGTALCHAILMQKGIWAYATNSWSSECTHVVEKSSLVTPELIQAVLARNPIVLSNWIKCSADAAPPQPSTGSRPFLLLFFERRPPGPPGSSLSRDPHPTASPPAVPLAEPYLGSPSRAGLLLLP